jgi:hypothetical protein
MRFNTYRDHTSEASLLISGCLHLSFSVNTGIKDLRRLFMRSLIKVLTLVFALCALTAHAASDLPGNIAQGNVQTGGNFRFSNTWYKDSTTESYFLIEIPLQYFVVDRFALGVVVDYSHDALGGASTDELLAGPAFTYYFWTQDKIGAYLSESIVVGKDTGYSAYYLNTAGLGFNYFITPSVALGPAFAYGHLFAGASEYTSYNQLAFVANFSIYL